MSSVCGISCSPEPSAGHVTLSAVELAAIVERDADWTMRNALADRRALLVLLRETREAAKSYWDAVSDWQVKQVERGRRPRLTPADVEDRLDEVYVLLLALGEP